MDMSNIFYLLKPKPARGYAWQYGKLSGVHKATPRPDFVFPDTWTRMNKEAKNKAIETWSRLQPQIRSARTSRNLHHIAPEIKVQYEQLLEDVVRTRAIPEAPALPCISRERENASLGLVTKSKQKRWKSDEKDM